MRGLKQTTIDGDALAAALRLPPGVTWGWILIPEAAGVVRPAYLHRRYHPPEAITYEVGDTCPPYTIHLFGAMVIEVPRGRNRPYVDLDDDHGIQIWYGMSELPDGHASTETLWLRTGAETMVHLKTGRWTNGSLLAIASATRWLEALPRTGGAPAMSNEDAFAEAVRFGLEWLDDHPNRTVRDLRSHHLAARKVIEPKSYEKWMGEKGFGIKAVRAKLGELRGEK